MTPAKFTAAQFIAYAEKKNLQLHAIIKKLPAGDMLLGFEYGKRSRKYRFKYLLDHPIYVKDLRAGPIRKQADPGATAPAVAHAALGDLRDPLGIAQNIGPRYPQSDNHSPSI